MNPGAKMPGVSQTVFTDEYLHHVICHQLLFLQFIISILCYQVYVQLRTYLIIIIICLHAFS